MNEKLTTLARAVALASVLTQTTGAADVAFLSGYAARPGLYPPPAKMAAPPSKAAPSKAAGMSLARRFSIDARLVEQWLETWLEPAPVSHPFESAVQEHVITPADFPPPAEPPRDRMMVVREPGFVGVVMANALDEIFPIDYHPAIYAKRLEGPWIEGRGVRFRINFFNVYGVTEGTADGFTVKMAHGYKKFVPAKVPEILRKTYPVYFHGDVTRAEIEIQNTGLSPISGLEAAARQETLSDNSQPGLSISEPVALPVRGTLAPGETATLGYSFRLNGPGAARVNFEQTHLVITSADSVLADEAKAAIVDPPNL